MQRLSFVSVLLLFLSFAVLSTDTLIISQFPHFQTFDTWNTCSYQGNCYELACNSLQGGWTNPEFHSAPPANRNVYNWWVNQGPTTSNVYLNGSVLPCSRVQTGPCGDHTNPNGTGKYLYAEASGCYGFYFKALSPRFVWTNANASVGIYYYLYGASLDTSNAKAYLAMYLSVNNGSWVSLFNVSGQIQTSGSKTWSHFTTILDSHFPAPANASVPVVGQFMLWARAAGSRGANVDYWIGDMAVDDFLVTQGGASSVLVPYTDPVTNTTNPVAEGGGDGISDGEIAGIVVGVLGGLCLLCCCLLLLLLLLLLVISPRGPNKKAAAAAAGGDDL